MREAFKKFIKAKKWDEALQCCEIIKDYKLYDTFRKEISKDLTEDGLALIKRSYDLCAREHFDDFMLALEWDRPAKDQFWLPRRAKLMEICNALEDLENDKLDELFISLPPRVGKALADDTPILTRNGWKNHGDLVVGDEVIGMNGEFKKVIAVHPKCQLDVLVKFTNGEEIQCHENHEWQFWDRGTKSYRLEETKYLETRKLYSGTPNKRGHRYILQLPPRAFVKGEKKSLPLDPYTFGAWLGDGANKNPRIANDKRDYAIIQGIIDNGHPIRWSTEHKITGVMYYEFDIRKELQTMGLCHSRKRNSKYIPETYLTADLESRLELLAGLLDTDGSLTIKENRYHFTTCEETLRDSVLELIATFGWRASLITHPPKVSSSGVIGKSNTYAIGFNPTCYIPCRLERKQLHKFSPQRKLSFTSITRVAPKRGNCITVEGDGMYLAGKSMIPTHNTTIINMFILWVMFRDSERSNLYCSFTESVVKVFYNGLLEILNDPYTYRWKELFPDSKVASTDGKDLLLNLDRKKRYASFTARSLYGTLNGACDCRGYEIADDLHSGIEEALSKDRLQTAWSRVTNNYLPRGKMGCKRLWIGTRWSLQDCIARRIDILENDPKSSHIRYKIVNRPALNENDESNFDYDYGVGFSTQTYQQIRSSFERGDDSASWLAQYQGEPIERSGALFSPEDFRLYNGVLPDEEPDRKFLAIDPAWGGGDYTASPICFQYGDDIFVHDVIFNDGDKYITQPEIVHKVMEYGIKTLFIEGTRTTKGYAEELSKKFSEAGYRVNIQTTTSHHTGMGKFSRICEKAPEIKEFMIFKESGYRDKEYQRFMENVYAFKLTKNNHLHDDAPDSLAMAMNFAYLGDAKVQVMKRFF